MFDADEIRWVKSTANELNNLLQVIAESSQLLEAICNETAETDKFFAMLQNSVERAAKVTRMMVDRVGGYTVEDKSAGETSGASTYRVARADIRVFNPQGLRELVLFVDDEDFVTVLAQRILAEEGYRVIVAKDGFQAIEIFRQLHNEIGLVILDYTMPVLDGADVFKELQQINRNVPVVLSSGFAEQERLRYMLTQGLRAFIPKPYNQQRLLEQVRAALDADSGKSTT